MASVLFLMRYPLEKDDNLKIKFDGQMAAVRAMGHEVEIVDDRTAMGRGEIIWKCENGVYAAGTEPRCDGTVASW